MPEFGVQVTDRSGQRRIVYEYSIRGDAEAHVARHNATCFNLDESAKLVRRKPKFGVYAYDRGRWRLVCKWLHKKGALMHARWGVTRGYVEAAKVVKLVKGRAI